MPDNNDLRVRPINLDVIHPAPPKWIDAVRRRPAGQFVLKGAQDGIDPGALEAARAQTHHVAVTGNVEFHDYETFGSDEHGFKSFRQETRLKTDDTTMAILGWKAGFGGEERVELDMEGSLREDGVLAVKLDLRFFEGATEGTTELEDSQIWQSVVPRGQTSNFSIHLANDEDDWATVRGTISNRVVAQ